MLKLLMFVPCPFVWDHNVFFFWGIMGSQCQLIIVEYVFWIIIWVVSDLEAYGSCSVISRIVLYLNAANFIHSGKNWWPWKKLELCSTSCCGGRECIYAIFSFAKTFWRILNIKCRIPFCAFNSPVCSIYHLFTV